MRRTDSENSICNSSSQHFVLDMGHMMQTALMDQYQAKQSQHMDSRPL